MDCLNVRRRRQSRATPGRGRLRWAERASNFGSAITAAHGKNPVAFVAHFPSVLDYGDGAERLGGLFRELPGIISVGTAGSDCSRRTLRRAAGTWTAYTFPSLAPPRANAKPVLFHHNAYSMALVTDLEGRPLWHFGMTRDTASTWGQFVDIDGDGHREILHAQPDGLLRCFPFGAPARCPSCAAEAPLPKGKESSQRWQLDLGRPISRMIAADVTGDGRMAVLFGGGDGKLHALGEREGKPRLLWSVPLGRRVGEPVLVDLDGDGRPALLVAAEDGRLYCLKGKGKAP